MLQRSNDGHATCVNQATIIVQYVHISANVPALLACENAKGLGVQGVASANSFLEQAGEDGFLLCLSGNLASVRIGNRRKGAAENWSRMWIVDGGNVPS